MTEAFEQRCWNHEGREASCRCPECRRSFCRECVAEHEARLLCASCLARVAQTAARQRSSVRGFAISLLFLGGLLIAWIVLFGAGESVLILAERAEQSWQNH